MKKGVIRPKIQSDWFSEVGGGMRLELSSELNGVSHQLLTILADDIDEELWVELYVEGKAVQVPLATVKAALEDALGSVHSEAWYDKNPPPSDES